MQLGISKQALIAASCKTRGEQLRTVIYRAKFESEMLVTNSHSNFFTKNLPELQKYGKVPDIESITWLKADGWRLKAITLL